MFGACNAIIACAGTSTELLIVDRLGRRRLEIYGSIVMGFMFLIGTILMQRYPAAVSNTPAHIGFIATTWVFNYVFFMTVGPMSWAIPAELFTIGSRMKGVSIGAMTSFAFNTMVGQTSPIGLKNVSWRFYILYTVTNFTNAFAFWALLPETKGIGLEEMEKIFEKNEWFVPTSKWEPTYELTHMTEQIAQKQGANHVEVTQA